MAQPVPQTSSDSQLLNLKVPPHSIDAEQSVLGGLLIDNSAFDRVGDVVTDGDFYRDDHRRIFRHVSRLIERGKPADVVTVDEAMKVSEDKDKTGGITYLAALAGNTPSAHNVRRYAEIVRECAVLRKLIEVSTEIADSALNRMGKDVGQLLDEAESKVFQIAEAGARTPLDGKDRARAQYGRARRGGEQASRRRIQHGNVGDPARDAHAGIDRAAGSAQAAHRETLRRRLEPPHQRRREAARRADPR